MIFVTGDTHIPIDIGKLSTNKFTEQKRMKKDDFVIICGDFGGIWDKSKERKFWLKWLNEKNFTTLFVDGNHENFPMLYEYETMDFMGGTARQIMPSIYHLCRGEVFTISGLKFFAMGGASSHDKEYRIEGRSWWPEEIPSNEELYHGLDTLKANDNKVDFIITHCLPDSVQANIALWYEHDKLTNFFEIVKQTVEYQHWYCGHYHLNGTFDTKHTVLYNKIIRIV